MTKQDYSKTFEQEVSNAREMYPEETKNTIFVDLSADDALDKIEEWLDKMPPDVVRQGIGPSAADKERFLLAQLGKPGFAANVDGNKIVAVRTDARDGMNESDFRTVFRHELAHIVVPAGSREIDPADYFKDPTFAEENKTENAADAFMALHGLQSGFLTPVKIDDISAKRALAAWRGGDFGHLTSPVLDDIVVRVENATIISLTPQQIKQIAQHYAEAFTPKNESAFVQFASAFHPIYPKGDNQARDLKELTDACYNAPAESLEFYTASRIMGHAFKQGYGDNIPNADQLKKVITDKAVSIGAEKTLANFEAPKKDINTFKL